MTDAPRQLPQDSELFLDHIAHFVPDMDAAGAALERLGYILTPFTAQQNSLKPGDAPVPAGTANRLVMLRRGYLEFLTAVVDTPLAQQLQDAVKRYVGVHLLAFAVGDAQAAWERLAATGFAPTPLVHLERAVGLPQGGSKNAKFSVVRVPPGTMPEGRIQILTHHTESIVWQERWMAHPNRIVALTDILLAVADPQEAAQRFARFLDRKAEQDSAGRWHLATDRGVLTFVTPASVPGLLPGMPERPAPFIAAYGLESADLDVSERHFREAGAAIERLDDRRLRLDLPAALGGTQIVCAPGAIMPWRD
ncbi:MAG: VOC family protein [Alphaproteobacteria bacterium]|nr:VOC family protein [Alphaproteobacteria bacterium]MBU0796756.1 VOC family protein [Alphaproteobacteria bacterium]MBU0888280.1 VOC family protein [Alphaproteobacteria bacterium]MBU1811481.1 VOC family protein [Alphaproteobacteria bacterium]MBU2090161.1 VOC family protein [Alphaproteobacteria bacterium]